MFMIFKDIKNLYSSRDKIWKELFKFQQTEKRRDKELRQRLHRLERRLSELSNHPDNRSDSTIQSDSTGVSRDERLPQGVVL